MSSECERETYPQLTEDDLEYASNVLSNARIIAKQANGDYSESAQVVKDFIEHTNFSYQISDISKELDSDAQMQCLSMLSSDLEVTDGSAIIGFAGRELLYYYFATLNQTDSRARYVNKAIWRLLTKIYAERSDDKLPVKRMVVWLALIPVALILLYFIVLAFVTPSPVILQIGQMSLFLMILASMVRGFILANSVSHHVSEETTSSVSEG